MGHSVEVTKRRNELIYGLGIVYVALFVLVIYSESRELFQGLLRRYLSHLYRALSNGSHPYTSQGARRGKTRVYHTREDGGQSVISTQLKEADLALERLHFYTQASSRRRHTLKA